MYDTYEKWLKETGNDKLSQMQQVFCLQYIKLESATKACIEAGYSAKTAEAMGAKNLSKSNIMSYIEYLRRDSKKRLMIDNDYITEKLMQIVELDPLDYVDNPGGGNSFNMRAIKDIPENVRRLISKVKSKTRNLIGDLDELTNEIELEIHFPEKMKALEMLCKRIGYFEADNNQKNPGKSEGYDLSKLSDEELITLRNIHEKANPEQEA